MSFRRPARTTPGPRGRQGSGHASVAVAGQRALDRHRASGDEGAARRRLVPRHRFLSRHPAGALGGGAARWPAGAAARQLADPTPRPPGHARAYAAAGGMMACSQSEPDHMTEEDVRRQAFAMPLTNPAFPAGPYRFVDREYLIITYRTDPVALARLLPAPLVAIEPLVKYEFINMPDSTGFGHYCESGQGIPVRLGDAQGGY